MKPSWAGLVASLLVMCASSAASAVSAVSAAPACFPERITLGRIGVFDGAGELFGFVEENQTVRVLAAGVGLAGRYSQVELKVPERLVGYVQNDRLAVVAARDIPIQPGLSWWLRGTHFIVLSGDARNAQVVSAPLDHDKMAGRRGDVPCSALRGMPIRTATRLAAGEKGTWSGTRRLESQTGMKSIPLDGGNVTVDDKHRTVGIIEHRDEAVLVEVVDEEQGLRARGWTTSEGVSTDSNPTRTMACSCRDTVSMWPPGGVPVRLSRAAQVLSLENRHVLTRLPRGMEVRIQSLQGDMVLAYWSHARDAGQDQSGFLGFLPRAEFSEEILSDVNVIVRGRCAPDSPPSEPRIRARFVPDRMDRAFVFNLEISKDGSFSFVAPVIAKSFAFWATSLDGLWVSKEAKGSMASTHTGEQPEILILEHKDP
jgi:hypothetical protein